MQKHLAPIFAVLALATMPCNASAQGSKSFTIDQVKSYPFPNELTAQASGSRIAWASNERGLRNLLVAEGPDWKARQLSNYKVDDGQELTSIAISGDGKYVVYVRGGEHSANWQGTPPNPTSNPIAPKVQIWSLPFTCATSCEPKMLAEGDDPELSPRGDRVAFIKDRQIWIVPTDGSTAAKKLFSANGDLDNPRWSPDGATRLHVRPRRSLICRHLRERLDFDSLDRTEHLARWVAAMVS